MLVKVSVVIPTYNRRDLVSQAIKSVLAQTYSDYEIIVVDDGSTDGTDRALAVFSDKIYFVWQENQGESVARNQGIALAQGDYIALLDSDDLWEPEKLAEQMAVLDADPTIVLLGCQSWIIDEHGKKLFPTPSGVIHDLNLLTYPALRKECHFYGPSTALIQKKAIQKVGGFAEDIRYGEDWELWLRLSRVGTIAVLPKTLASVRTHQSTQTSVISDKTIDARLHDHITILHRNPPENNATVDPALAKQYLRAAIDDISIGRLLLAHERLLQSQEYDGGHVIQLEGIEMVIARAMALASPDFAPIEQVSAFFETALDSLDHIHPISSSARRENYSKLYLALASMARSVHNWPASRKNLWKAFQVHPQTWHYGGFWGGLLESILGAELYQSVRKISRPYKVK